MCTAENMQKNATVERKERSGTRSEERLEMESNLLVTDTSRLVEFMQAVHQIGRLRREAANSQVDARQKMREVSFKRQSVWVCDAAFMREVQQLVSGEPLEKFAKLHRLAAECQAARDGLGPLEQEGVEAEQQWEGHNWTLRQAEEGLYDEFKDDFELADAFPAPTLSASSSQYRSYSDTERNDGEDVSDEGQIRPLHHSDSMLSTSNIHARSPGRDIPASSEHHTSQFLLGLAYVPPSDGYVTEWDTEWDSDSGIGEIDHAPDNPGKDELTGLPQDLPLRHNAITERYPELSTNFGTRRSRINKWLLHMMLLSHLEADLLVAQFDSENVTRPSNWSQLVIAYWELDAAAVPIHTQLSALQAADSPHDSLDQLGDTKRERITNSTNPAETTKNLLRDLSYPGDHARRDSITSPILRPRAGIGWKAYTI